MFGMSFDEKVQKAVEHVRASTPVRDLAARVEGKVVTLTGEASDVAVKARAMQEFNAQVETENTINQIHVASLAGTGTVSTSGGTGAFGTGNAPHVTPAVTTPTSTLSPAPTPTTTPAAATARIHEVVKGDTLSAIAKTYYGHSSEYDKIFQANRDQLKDADHIYPGQKLRIP